MVLAIILLVGMPAMMIAQHWKLSIFLVLAINIAVIVHVKYHTNSTSARWNVWKRAIPSKIVALWSLLGVLLIMMCLRWFVYDRDILIYALTALMIIPLIIYGHHLAQKTENFWKKYIYLSLFIILALGGTTLSLWEGKFRIFLIILFPYIAFQYVCIGLPADLLVIIEALTNRTSLIPPKEEKSIESAKQKTEETKAIPAPATVPPVKESRTITPLLEAILSGNADNVRAALTEHPELLNTAYAQNGNTPLHVAALNGQTEIVKLLLAQPGIDKTLTNKDGQTARDLAQERNFPEIIGLL